MSYIVVDVEADGEIPHKYSMVCFGAVVVEPSLSKTFYGETKPVSDNWIPKALAVSGFTRQQHLAFAAWLLQKAIVCSAKTKLIKPLPSLNAF